MLFGVLGNFRLSRKLSKNAFHMNCDYVTITKFKVSEGIKIYINENSINASFEKYSDLLSRWSRKKTSENNGWACFISESICHQHSSQHGFFLSSFWLDSLDDLVMSNDQSGSVEFCGDVGWKVGIFWEIFAYGFNSEAVSDVME